MTVLASDGAVIDPAVLAMLVLGALLVIPALIADLRRGRRLPKQDPHDCMERFRHRHEIDRATRAAMHGAQDGA